MAEIIIVIVDKIVNPIILVMFVLAIVVFLWGIFRFVASDQGAEGRENGKRNMVWGVVGMFIMVSAYGIIEFIKATLQI